MARSSCDMKQTRLGKFFGYTQGHVEKGASPFLDLPAAIRNRIYHEYNLWREDHVHLNIEKYFDEEYEPEFDKDWPSPERYCGCRTCRLEGKTNVGWWCTSRPILPLLLACHTIYNEVCPIWYSQNQFKISQAGPGGLQGLFNLGALAMSSLKFLTISLNECKAICQKHEGYSACYKECDKCAGWLEENTARRPPILPLGCISRDQKRVIRDWSNLCKFMAQFLQRAQLKLSLVCDVHDEETARQIIQPMIDTLPLLSGCSIRLSPENRPELRSMAENATLFLTDRSSSSSAHSPYWLCGNGSTLGRPTSNDSLSMGQIIKARTTPPTLPQELQCQILTYTELVAPHDLLWLPGQRLQCRSLNPWKKGWEPVRGHYALNPCELCFSVHRPCYDFEDYDYEAPIRGSLASQCCCWRFPFELFLVSRQTYHVSPSISSPFTRIKYNGVTPRESQLLACF